MERNGWSCMPEPETTHDKAAWQLGHKEKENWPITEMAFAPTKAIKKQKRPGEMNGANYGT